MNNVQEAPKVLEQMTIDQLAAEILSQCTSMRKYCQEASIASPSLVPRSDNTFWSTESCPKLIASRTKTLGLLERLSTLIRGPHEFIHEFVASNWDQGALYVFLRAKILEHIARLGEQANVGNLAAASKIPQDKLFRILGLLRCKDIIHESDDGNYILTAISEDLLRDPDFRAWVEFQ